MMVLRMDLFLVGRPFVHHFIYLFLHLFLHFFLLFSFFFCLFYRRHKKATATEKADLLNKLVVAEERQLELEAEVRSLKAAVVDAQTNAEQLEEMSR